MGIIRSRLAWALPSLVLLACVTEAPPDPDKLASSTPLARASKASVADGGRDGATCTGLECQVQSCGDETNTVITGTVYAPNGTLPIYNATVYIPNAALTPPTAGVSCNTCSTPLSGSPITVATTDAKGAFTLTNAPSGTDIPIVVQLGKWRRETTIPKVTACTTNALTDPDRTRLPKNQTEGTMPRIAVTTGGCDQMGCVLPKLGIDATEFGYESDGAAKAVNTYTGQGGATLSGATLADKLWKNSKLLSEYDMAIFACECSESLGSKGGSDTAPEFGVVTDYMNAGGRVLTSDFQYTWYKYSPDPKIGGVPAGSDTIGIGEIIGGAPLGDSPIHLDTGTTGGKALADWLQASYSTDPYGQVTPDYTFANIQSLNHRATKWAHSNTPSGSYDASAGEEEPRIFTLDTPVGAPTCGQGTHVDLHVDQTGDIYPTSCSSTMTEAEAMIAFYIFNMATCLP